MTEPQNRANISHLDFTVGCRYPRSMIGGKPCTQPAEYWVSVHRVAGCTHPSLENGCASSFVCADHLEALEMEADRIVRRHNPSWFARLFNHRKPWCPSCGRQQLQIQSDVLHCVKEL